MTEWIGQTRVDLFPRSITNWFVVPLICMTQWISQCSSFYLCFPWWPTDMVLVPAHDWMNRSDASVMFWLDLTLFRHISFLSWSFGWVPIAFSEPNKHLQRYILTKILVTIVRLLFNHQNHKQWLWGHFSYRSVPMQSYLKSVMIVPDQHYVTSNTTWG